MAHIVPSTKPKAIDRIVSWMVSQAPATKSGHLSARNAKSNLYDMAHTGSTLSSATRLAQKVICRDVDAMVLLVDGGELAVLEVGLDPVVHPGQQLGLVLAHADGQIIVLHGDLRLDRARRVLLADRRQQRTRRRQDVDLPGRHGQGHGGVVLVAHELRALGLLGEVGVLRGAAYDGDL